jgi:hypothetical protein
MAELRIPIIVENKGKKALGDVDKSVKGLSKSFKKLAGAAGIGLSTAAVIKFGKEAAKAFIADEKAASRLAMSVKNLGLGFETPRIERYISELSAMSGITDDQLRPAMQRLLQTTGSVTKSQELLTQALDISRGSGVDYETVVNDLSMAYVGNTKGLNKYGLGLTKAELKTMKFADVQAKFAATFKGGNAAYLDTYAGKFELIATAAGEAQEKIGGALVESLVSVFAAGDPVEFVAKIEALSGKIADMVAQVVFGFKKLYYLTSDQAILAAFNPFDDYENQVMRIIDSQEKAFLASFNRIKIGYLGSMPVGIYSTPANDAARKKAEADALKRAKELAAAQTKSLAEAKKKAALEKAAGTLDIQRIGLTAALKSQISETDKLSLGLQLALLDKNETAASKLSGQLEAAIKRQNDLNALLLATPEAPNPYRNWKIPGLDYGGNKLGTPVPPGADLVPLPPTDPNGQGPRKYVPQMPSDSVRDFGPGGGLRAGVIAGVTGQPSYIPEITIQVELDGQAVGGAIRDTQINDSLSGSFNQVNRGQGFKGAVAL